MEKNLLKFALYQLRIVGIAVILLLPATFLVSFKSNKFYVDFWQQLGITEKDGAYSIRESFINGYLQHYGARNLKNIAVGDRAAVTKDLLAYTKTYVQSTEFKTAYTALRKQRMPVEPKKPETEEEIRQKSINGIKEGIANIEKALKTAQPQYKKTYQDTYDMLTKQLKEYEDPNNEMIKLMVQTSKSQYEFSLNDYNESMKKWEVNFPESSSLFVKRRLQEMLDATANVDYNAELVEKNGKKYFAKQEYERKPANWKTAFRAGKEATENARAMVQQWIKELN